MMYNICPGFSTGGASSTAVTSVDDDIVNTDKSGYFIHISDYFIIWPLIFSFLVYGYAAKKRFCINIKLSQHSPGG